MYENIDDLYNESYHDFYKTCEYKELISSDPIPCKIDNSLKFVGQYNDGIITLRKPSFNTSDEVRELTSTLYHEFTHYYDESIFKHLGYQDDDIETLMLTYSEIHAAYNGIFMFLNLKNLSVKKRIDLNRIKFKNRAIVEYIAFQITKEINSMNNILGFKNSMYLLGEKRAFLKIARDVSVINRAYNFKRIPEVIRNEIINIDKLVDLTSYENIEVKQINLNKLKIENELCRISIKNVPFPNIEGMDEIKQIIDSL